MLPCVSEGDLPEDHVAQRRGDKYFICDQAAHLRCIPSSPAPCGLGPHCASMCTWLREFIMPQILYALAGLYIFILPSLWPCCAVSSLSPTPQVWMPVLSIKPPSTPTHPLHHLWDYYNDFRVGVTWQKGLLVRPFCTGAVINTSSFSQASSSASSHLSALCVSSNSFIHLVNNSYANCLKTDIMTVKVKNAVTDTLTMPLFCYVRHWSMTVRQSQDAETKQQINMQPSSDYSGCV